MTRASILSPKAAQGSGHPPGGHLTSAGPQPAPSPRGSPSVGSWSCSPCVIGTGASGVCPLLDCLVCVCGHFPEDLHFVCSQWRFPLAKGSLQSLDLGKNVFLCLSLPRALRVSVGSCCLLALRKHPYHRLLGFVARAGIKHPFAPLWWRLSSYFRFSFVIHFPVV